MHVFPVSEMQRSHLSRELQGKDCGRPGVSLILVEAAPGPSDQTSPRTSGQITR